MIRVTTEARWGLIFLNAIQKASISCLFMITYDDDLEMQVAIFDVKAEDYSRVSAIMEQTRKELAQ